MLYYNHGNIFNTHMCPMLKGCSDIKKEQKRCENTQIKNIDKENKGQLLSFIQFKQGGNRVVSVVQYNSFQMLYTWLQKGNVIVFYVSIIL